MVQTPPESEKLPTSPHLHQIDLQHVAPVGPIRAPPAGIGHHLDPGWPGRASPPGRPSFLPGHTRKKVPAPSVRRAKPVGDTPKKLPRAARYVAQSLKMRAVVW